MNPYGVGFPVGGYGNQVVMGTGIPGVTVTENFLPGGVVTESVNYGGGFGMVSPMMTPPMINPGFGVGMGVGMPGTVVTTPGMFPGVVTPQVYYNNW